MGNTADPSALKTYGPGDFLYIPPRHAHWGGSTAQGPSVIQLHGEGPFQLVLGAPK
jgi:quercetin dioxygenase-like cupin family protein